MELKQQKIINNTLYIGDYSVNQLAEKYKTPLYVYDQKQIEEKINIYKNSFKDNQINCHTVYASKAFIAPHLIKIIQENDLYIDCISLNDLLLLKKMNFDFKKIVLHGNNKSDEELEYALSNNVGYIICDNYNELLIIEEKAKLKNIKPKVMLRVNPGIEAHTHAFIQTSLISSKFGESIFDTQKLDLIFDFIKKSKVINFVGFHAHIGSQISNSETFYLFTKKMINFTNEVNLKYNLTLDEVNFGGGFSIKYLDSDPDIDLKTTVLKMVTIIKEEAKNLNLKLTHVFIEPGRSIVGDSCITLYKCGGIKKTYSGLSYIFIDGGMGDNIRPSLYDASYSFYNGNKYYHNSNCKFNIAGKCCESGDIIGKDIVMDIPKVGDIIVSYGTGAYCYSMSMNYNMLSKPGVIFVNEDKITETIKHESFDDLIKTYNF